jgi:hypothetical protein
MRYVLTNEQLILEARRLATMNQRLPVLLLLAHVTRPATTRAVIDRGLEVGFRKIGEWNVTDVLKSADRASQVVQLGAGWQLLEPGFAALNAAGVELDARPTVKPSDSILPRELFANTRAYIERVVSQINGSYDHGFYDCCAVMCRRLVETLIIEVYESRARARDIKATDDNFLSSTASWGYSVGTTRSI